MIVKKVSEQGRDAIGAQHTPFGPHSALTIIGWRYGSKVCVMCDDSIPTFLHDHIHTFLYILMIFFYYLSESTAVLSK